MENKRIIIETPETPINYLGFEKLDIEYKGSNTFIFKLKQERENRRFHAISILKNKLYEIYPGELAYENNGVKTKKLDQISGKFKEYLSGIYLTYFDLEKKAWEKVEVSETTNKAVYNISKEIEELINNFKKENPRKTTKRSKRSKKEAIS